MQTEYEAQSNGLVGVNAYYTCYDGRDLNAQSDASSEEDLVADLRTQASADVESVYETPGDGANCGTRDKKWLIIADLADDDRGYECDEGCMAVSHNNDTEDGEIECCQPAQLTARTYEGDRSKSAVPR